MFAVRVQLHLQPISVDREGTLRIRARELRPSNALSRLAAGHFCRCTNPALRWGLCFILSSHPYTRSFVQTVRGLTCGAAMPRAREGPWCPRGLVYFLILRFVNRQTQFLNCLEVAAPKLPVGVFCQPPRFGAQGSLSAHERRLRVELHANYTQIPFCPQLEPFSLTPVPRT